MSLFRTMRVQQIEKGKEREAKHEKKEEQTCTDFDNSQSGAIGEGAKPFFIVVLLSQIPIRFICHVI